MSAERIETEAGDWLAKRLSGHWTEADQGAFDAWYADIGHRVAYVRLETAWNEAGRLRALGAGVPAGVVPPRQSWGDLRFPGGTPAEGESAASATAGAVEVAPALTPTSSPLSSARQQHPARSSWPRWAAAAVVLVALAAGLWIFLDSPFTGDRYSTPVGGLNDVRLVDGSHITLNTDTHLRVRLSQAERRIDLDRGEAFFEVAHDPARPFVVYAGDKRVMAVGTKFSVRRERDDVEVVVTEGKVKLATADASPSGSAGPPVTLLPAGTVAKTAKTAVLVHEESAPETEAHLSWRNGYVVFKDTTLEDAANTFNRYNTRQIVIGDPQIATVRIGGNFRSNNIESFLSLLKDGFPIIVEETEDQAILKAR
jgi:transmembrane sensor